MCEISRPRAISCRLVIVTASRYVVWAKLDVFDQILVGAASHSLLVESARKHTTSFFLHKVILCNCLKFSVVLCADLSNRVCSTLDKGVVLGEVDLVLFPLLFGQAVQSLSLAFKGNRAINILLIEVLH